MLEDISQCNKCELYKNQKPLLDTALKCDVFWVGLSAKQAMSDIEKPLSATTNSGKVICEIEKKYIKTITYKTNLVKCLPLDDRGKLRYPKQHEMELCMLNLEKEICELSPKVIFLLGNKVTDTVGKYFSIKFEKIKGYEYKLYKHEDNYFVPIHHPSYIWVYKRKQMNDYYFGVKNVLCKMEEQNENSKY
jgi:DNA polymerase